MSEAPTGPRPVPLPALALAIFTANLGLGIIFPLVPHLAASSPAGPAAVGWIFSCYALTLVGAQVAGGVLADRLDAGRVLAAALALYMATLLGFALARGVPELMLLRGLEGLAVGTAVPCVMTLVVRSVATERLGRGMGFVMGFGGLGFIVGPLAGGWLAPLGLSLPFLVAAAVAGLACLAVTLTIPPQACDLDTEGRLSGALAFEARSLIARLRGRPFWALVLPLMALKINFSTLQAGLPLIGDRVLGVDLAEVSYLFVITAVAYAVVQPVAGRLADRYPTRGLLTVAFLGMVPLLVLLAHQTSYVALLIPYVAFSFFQTGGVLFALKHLGDGLGERAQGRAFGLASAIGDMGMIIAPSALLPLFAWRHEALLDALAGVMGVALLLFLGLSRGGTPARPLSAGRTSGEHGGAELPGR